MIFLSLIIMFNEVYNLTRKLISVNFSCNAGYVVCPKSTIVHNKTKDGCSRKHPRFQDL